MAADDSVAFELLIGLISPLLFFITINEVKTITFFSQAAPKRFCQVAADIPRKLIKS